MGTARGRHAPPPEVRLPLQRERLLGAAALEFSERGYAGASSDTISRRAAMSKATFYEHFANKQECILALCDHAVAMLQDSMVQASRDAPRGDAVQRMSAGVSALLAALADHPEYAQVLFVEVIGAGPAAAARRDEILQGFAAVLDAENEAEARRGLSARFASEHDAYAAVGAIVELVSRQVRRGIPADILELAPVVVRLILGLTPVPTPQPAP